jgi:hypothetical protein
LMVGMSAISIALPAALLIFEGFWQGLAAIARLLSSHENVADRSEGSDLPGEKTKHNRGTSVICEQTLAGWNAAVAAAAFGSGPPLST